MNLLTGTESGAEELGRTGTFCGPLERFCVHRSGVESLR